MEKEYKSVKLKFNVWQRLRNLAYDNRTNIPAFLTKLMDKWEEK